jgi:phospholipase/carboxylesterase
MPGAHVISARGDVSEHGAARFFRRTGEGVYDMADLAARTTRMASFVSEHRERFKPPKVIGLGYSNGANILASVILEQADLFDAVVLLHPLIPWNPEDQAGLAKLQVLVTAGNHDPICPPGETDRFFNYLTRQQANVELYWHEGGHEIGQGELEAIRGFLLRTKDAATSAGGLAQIT